MIIKETAFGNDEEAFIENRFNNATNIVFSNENNKGKTLLMQSLMYSIGYDSIFPSGFDYKNFHYYSRIEFNGIEFEFLRKKNSILVLNREGLSLFNSISEFKYYFDSKIFNLPRITKNGEIKVVDLSLLYELFFLGQDKRNTSNLISKGQNNKTDFVNMIYALKGLEIIEEGQQDLAQLKNSKVELESKLKIDRRKLSIIKKDKNIASQVSSAANNIEYVALKNKLNDINQNISNLSRSRQREENRRIKLIHLVDELNSLNRNLSTGKVKCSDCGSRKVIFSNEDFEFDVSNNYVRNSILDSINQNIKIKEDIISEYTNSIEKEQLQLKQVLNNTPPEAKNFLIFQDEIISSEEIDQRITYTLKELGKIQKQIDNFNIRTESNKDLQKNLVESILVKMREYYKLIDPSGILEFEEIFTKNDQTYSGSEGQEYYFSKLMALNDELKHPFPILIDSFRDGEISSAKETLMLEEFKKLNKQVILTSTLKEEEYDSEKYYNLVDVNVIDYSSFEDSKILQASFVSAFQERRNRFGIL